MKDDDGPHLRLEPEEAAFELVAVGDRRRRRRRPPGASSRGQFDVDAMAPEPARLIDAGADEQPVEPGVEAVRDRAAWADHARPGRAAFWTASLACSAIPEDEPGGGVQPGDRGACQLGEGVMIAPPRSLHEISLHHAPRRRRGRSGRAQRVWRGDQSTVRSELRPGAIVGRGRRSTRLTRCPRPVPSAPSIGSPEESCPREDPGSRRQVAARRPGPAGPAWEVAHTVDEARGRRRALPRRRRAAGRHQGPGARRRPRQGRRREAGRLRRRGRAVAGAILGMDIKGITVRKVLVGPAADIVKEFYLSAVLDRAARRILLMGSAEGGVEIEQVAAEQPGGDRPPPRRPAARAARLPGPRVRVRDGPRRPPQGRRRDRQGPRPDDARLRRRPRRDQPARDRPRDAAPTGAPVERLVCLDAKVTLDDSALARHPGLEDLRDPDEEAPERPRGARGRPDVHQARRHDRLHGQRRRAWR